LFSQVHEQPTFKTMNATISHHRQHHTDATMGKLIGDLSKSLQTAHPHLSAEEATRLTREIQPDRLLHVSRHRRRQTRNLLLKVEEEQQQQRLLRRQDTDDSCTRWNADSSARNLYTMRSIDESNADDGNHDDDNASACSCDSSSPRL